MSAASRVLNWIGCNKRFTQSSNLTAHERTHVSREMADPIELKMQKY
jgi:uncharacterized Zn-finger protein